MIKVAWLFVQYPVLMSFAGTWVPLTYSQAERKIYLLAPVDMV